jgi:hypothetical protein
MHGTRRFVTVVTAYAHVLQVSSPSRLPERLSKTIVEVSKAPSHTDSSFGLPSAQTFTWKTTLFRLSVVLLWYFLTTRVWRSSHPSATTKTSHARDRHDNTAKQMGLSDFLNFSFSFVLHSSYRTQLNNCRSHSLPLEVNGQSRKKYFTKKRYSYPSTGLHRHWRLSRRLQLTGFS